MTARIRAVRVAPLRAVLLVVALLAALAGVAVQPAHAATDTLGYVANSGGNTVSEIDTATNTVTGGAIPVGNSPEGVAVTPDGTTAYVTNSGDGTVSVISTATNTVTATIGVGSDPIAVAITPDGTTAYVTNSGDRTVSVINTATNTVTATITLPASAGDNPDAVVVNPAGTLAYVGYAVGSGDISVISTSTNTVTSTFAIGAETSALAINEAGTYLYNAARTNSQVTVISIPADTVTARPLVIAPQGVAVNPAGTFVYVTSATGRVSVISTANNTVTATIVVGSNSEGVAVTPDGTTAYVTNSGSGTVSVISTASNTVTATISGFNGPDGIALFPAPSVPPLAVTTTGLPAATVGQPYSATLAATGGTPPYTWSVTAGNLPAGLALNPATGVISGTPTAGGTASFTAGVTDSGSPPMSASQALSITATFPFTGFSAPVQNPPAINMVHAGQAIPIKFSLGSDQGPDILAAGYPTAQQVSCATGVPVNTATETDTAGGSGLQDNGGGSYTYVWKTSKASAGTCQVFTLGLTDGTFHTADFEYAS